MSFVTLEPDSQACFGMFPSATAVTSTLHKEQPTDPRDRRFTFEKILEAQGLARRLREDVIKMTVSPDGDSSDIIIFGLDQWRNVISSLMDFYSMSREDAAVEALVAVLPYGLDIYLTPDHEHLIRRAFLENPRGRYKLETCSKLTLCGVKFCPQLACDLLLVASSRGTLAEVNFKVHRPRFENPSGYHSWNGQTPHWWIGQNPKQFFAKILPALAHVKRLRLHNTPDMNGAAFLAVSSLPNLESITVLGYSFESRSLDPFRNLANLTELDLVLTRIQQGEATKLNALTNLKILRLRDSNFDNDDAQSLAALVNLTELDVSRSSITGDGVTHLSALVNLTKLDLDGVSTDQASLASLATLTNLTDLNISDPSRDHNVVRGLATFTSLRTLRASSCAINDSNVDSLVPLTNLTFLDVSINNIGPSGAEKLATLTALVSLKIGRNLIHDDGAAKLKSLTNLTDLNVSHNGIGALGAASVSSLKNLTSLDISENSKNEIFQNLSGLTLLKELWINRIDSVIAVDLGSLEHLTAIQSNIGPSEAKIIAKLTNLTYLDICCNNKLQNDGLGCLTSLESLTYLNVRACGIDSIGAQHFKSFAKLKSLNIDRNPIGDDGALHLTKLKDLRELWMRNTKMREATRRRLAAIPHFTLIVT